VSVRLKMRLFDNSAYAAGSEVFRRVRDKITCRLALLIIGLLCCALLGRAQSFITISGKIADSETQEPLPYASITVTNSSLGTIANANGAFTIHIPPASINSTLQISMLGYQAFAIPIVKINSDDPLFIELKPAIAYLPEVVVKDSLTAKQILQKAYDRLRQNYSSKPYQLEGFYREIQKANGKYVSLIEAAVLIESRGMMSKSNDKIKLNQLRRSLGFENQHVPFWDNYNLLVGFLGQDFVKHKKKSLIKFKEAYRKENTSIDGVPVYVIDVNERPDFWLNTLYIQCDNYAIIRFEENYDRRHDPERSWTVETNVTAKAFPQLKKLAVTYRPFDGKYYPERCAMTFHAIYKDAITGNQLLDFEIDHQFVVTNRFFDNIHEIHKDDVLSSSISLKQLPLKYDSTFWRNYNVIRESPLDSLIRKDLESQSKLDDQFKRN
jgi:hypothetical protein